MKKVLAAALLCAVSSFATWDYFPIKEAGKGEVKAGVEYGMQGDWSRLGINAKARFSIIEGLEAALFTNFPMTWSYDGESCDSDITDCPPSMSQPVIGVRYWMPMGIGIALDVGIPFQGKGAEGGEDGAALSFTPAVQYSTNFTEQLSLGAQLSFSIPLEDGNKYTASKELGIGAELDYSIGSLTPFVGIDVAMQVTKPQQDGHDTGDTYTGIMPYVGVVYGINDMISVDASVAFGIGEDYYARYLTTDMPILISANVAVNF
ncbi:MAG: transporter [Fibromonadales bacterium]|nr:transporter [Fibromonadales bacterium]